MLRAGWGGLRRAARAENQREQGEQTAGERDESEQVVESGQRMRNLRDHVRGFMSRVGRNRLREQKRGTEAEFPKNFRHAREARHGARKVKRGNRAGWNGKWRSTGWPG